MGNSPTENYGPSNTPSFSPSPVVYSGFFFCHKPLSQWKKSQKFSDGDFTSWSKKRKNSSCQTSEKNLIMPSHTKCESRSVALHFLMYCIMFSSDLLCKHESKGAAIKTAVNLNVLAGNTCFRLIWCSPCHAILLLSSTVVSLDLSCPSFI